MTQNELFQILRMQYGAIKAVADAAGVSSETVKNVLLLGFESQYKDTIISSATHKADEILLAKIDEADITIAQASNEKTRYSDLRGYLANGIKSTPVAVTA